MVRDACEYGIIHAVSCVRVCEKKGAGGVGVDRPLRASALVLGTGDHFLLPKSHCRSMSFYIVLCRLFLFITVY
jgi:hypothetical protein